MKVTGFYKDGERIAELLEIDRKRYSGYAKEKTCGHVSREKYKAIEEYIEWILGWITEREGEESNGKHSV